MKKVNSKNRNSYASVGIDVAAIRESQSRIAKRLAATFDTRKNRIGEVITPIGHYAGIIRVNDHLAMASHCDGVGTKVLIAQRAQKYNTVGIDCVAMNVNDLICLGAEPTTLIDYIALEEHHNDLLEPLIDGLAQGALEAQVAITGGETAIMGKVIKGDRPGYGFDLAACVCGFLNPNEIIDGSRIKPGDEIFGFPSSGFHSNGYTLLRHLLFEQEDFKITDKFPKSSNTIAEVLLEPTRIYVSVIKSILDNNIPLHGIAHITGGAFSKLARITQSKYGFVLESFPEPGSMFTQIQEIGGISDQEMFSTFNCGIGMVIVVPPNSTAILKDLERTLRYPAIKLGHVTDETGVRIVTPQKSIIIPF